MHPFPWQLLERIEREDLGRCRQLRGQLGAEAGEAFQRWATSCFTEGKVQLLGVVDAVPFRAPTVKLSLAGPRGAQAVLVVGAKLVSVITSKLLATEAAPLIGEPSAAEHGLVAYGVACLLGEMPDCPWSVDIARDDSPTADMVVFEAKVAVDGQAGLVWLAVGRDVLFNGHQASAKKNLRLVEQMSMLVSIVGGRFPLPLDDVETLLVGDLILSPGCPPVGEVHAWLDVGAGAFPVEIEQQNARVSGPFAVGVEAMRAEQERDQDTVADHVVIDVVVEMARVRMTGAELMSLGQGDVITLERPVGSSVVLRAGGRLLARGELVEVEGEAGVRLTEIG